MLRRRTTLTAALLLTLPVAHANTLTPATDVPAACGSKLDQSAWMFQGQHGYFYYGDELSGRWMNRAWNDARTAFALGAARLAAALKAQGVTLVVAPVAPRSFVTAGHLGGPARTLKAFDVNGAQTFYTRLVADLRAAGVPTADLLGPALKLGDAGVFRQDIHWTPEGARVAAQAVTATVKALKLRVMAAPFRSLPVGTVTRQVQDQPVLGQLAALCGLTVSPETYSEYRTLPAAPVVAAPGNFGESEGTMRWAYGPAASVAYALPAAATVTVDATFDVPLDGQGVEVLVAGKVIDRFPALRKGDSVTRRWTVEAPAGVNRLDFRFAAVNGGKTTFAPGDGRPLAVLFRTLTVTAGSAVTDLVKGDVRGSGLLDGAADVVLVGASSSLPALNFAGFLQEGLGTRVDNVSFGGAGVFSSLKDYLLDDAYAQHRPAVLIWQVPLLGGDDTLDADFRFVNAAAQGVREGRSVRGTGTVALDTPGASPHALRVHAEDASVTDVKVTLSTAAGTKTFTIRNAARMTHRQDFLLSLDDLGVIRRVVVTGRGPLTLTVTP